MRSFKLAVLLVVVLTVFALAVQNTETVTLRFLVWELSMSRFLLLMIVFLLGAMLGALAPTLVRREISASKDA